MLFIRIIEKGCNVNGLVKFKLVGYKPTDYKPEQFDYWSYQTMKNLGFGRINQEGHSITTTLYKFQIIETLDEKIGKGNYNYIFE